MKNFKIELKEDHIKLIENFKFKHLNDYVFGVDTINPYGGDFLFEDLAIILGVWDKHVKGTEYDIDGRKYGSKLENEMISIHSYVMDNIDLIIDILFNQINTGLKSGIYTYNRTTNKWIYSEN